MRPQVRILSIAVLILICGADRAVVAQISGSEAQIPKINNADITAAALIESNHTNAAEPAIVPKRHGQFREYRFAVTTKVSTLGVGVDLLPEN